MFKKICWISLVLISGVASATDPIATGAISNLSYREGYYLFQIVNGSTNYCSSCPPDPGHMTMGGYCWIAETNKAQSALLLSAHAQQRMMSGRVYGLSADCAVYQMTIRD